MPGMRPTHPASGSALQDVLEVIERSFQLPLDEPNKHGLGDLEEIPVLPAAGASAGA